MLNSIRLLNQTLQKLINLFITMESKSKIKNLFEKLSLLDLLAKGEESRYDLDQYDVFCLDIDHTLALYKNCNLSELIWNCIANHLINTLDYPNILDLESNPLFKELDSQKSHYYSLDIVLDKINGCALKLADNHAIVKAYKGFRELSEVEINTFYIDGKYLEFDIHQGKTNNYRLISGWYDYPLISIFLFLVELKVREADNNLEGVTQENLAKIKNLPDYSKLTQDIVDAMIFNYANYDLSTGEIFPLKSKGTFFSQFLKDLEKYLCNKYSSRDLLLNLKKKNKHIALITNSTYEFSKLVMSNIVGEDYLDFCDMIIYYSNKPQFFSTSPNNRNKTYFLDPTTSNQTGDEIKYSDKEEQNELYSACESKKEFILGNYKFVEWFFQRQNSKLFPESAGKQLKYLMIGDSPLSDCYFANLISNWQGLFVLSSLESKEFNNVSIAKGFGDRWGKYFHFNEEERDSVNDNITKLSMTTKLIQKENILIVPHIEYLDLLTSSLHK